MPGPGAGSRPGGGALPLSPLARRLQRHLRATGLLPEGCRCLVAFSGGGDSTALLHLLRELGVDCHAAHLDHGLRPESAREARRCRQHCEALGVPFHGERREVPRGEGSPEAAARRVRYRFLLEVGRRIGAGRVATGHTADDQAETVLLRLMSGCGVGGLAGIRPRRGGVIRPLLPFTRKELRAYLRERGVEWLEDPSNLDPAQPRARVRTLLLPRMKRENPRIVEALARMAEAARLDDAYLRRRARAAWRRLAPRGFPAEEMVRLPSALRRRVLARLAPGASSSHLLALEDLLAGPAGRSLSLPGGRVARRHPHRLVVGAAPESGAPPEVPVPLQSEVDLPGWRLRLILEQGGAPGEPEPWCVAFDMDRLVAPLAVRPRRPGDRFRPYRGAGTVRLKKFLHQRGVPREERDRVPLLTSRGRIAWVMGHRPDERFVAARDCRRVLRIRVVAQEPAGASRSAGP